MVGILVEIVADMDEIVKAMIKIPTNIHLVEEVEATKVEVAGAMVIVKENVKGGVEEDTRVVEGG